MKSLLRYSAARNGGAGRARKEGGLMNSVQLIINRETVIQSNEAQWVSITRIPGGHQ